MSEHWADLYAYAVQAFAGDRPGRMLEQRCAAAFQRAPAAVRLEVDRVAADLRAGRLRSPWPVLARRLEWAPVFDVVADGTDELERLERLALAWVRNAGRLAPWSECELELFGRRGRLERS